MKSARTAVIVLLLIIFLHSATSSTAASIMFDTSSSGVGSGSAASGRSVDVSLWTQIKERAVSTLTALKSWLVHNIDAISDIAGTMLVAAIGYHLVMFQFKHDTHGRSIQHDDHLELFYIRKMICEEYKEYLSSTEYRYLPLLNPTIRFCPYHRIYIGRLPAPMYFPFPLYLGYLFIKHFINGLGGTIYCLFSIVFVVLYISTTLLLPYTKYFFVQLARSICKKSYMLSLSFPFNTLYSRAVSTIILLVAGNEWIRYHDIDSFVNAEQRTNSASLFPDFSENDRLSDLLPTIVYYESLWVAYCVAFARSNHSQNDIYDSTNIDTSISDHLSEWLDRSINRPFDSSPFYHYAIVLTWLMACRHIQTIDCTEFHVLPEKLERQKESLYKWMFAYYDKITTDNEWGRIAKYTSGLLYDKFCNTRCNVIFGEFDAFFLQNNRSSAINTYVNDWNCFYNFVSETKDECLNYVNNYERLI